MARPFTVGVISDTHGLLRPEALATLQDCDRLIHAGDLGKPGIFEQLSLVAPTVAVCGNVDRGPWAEAFPETLTLTLAGVRMHVLHDLQTLALDPSVSGVNVIVSGHSHRPVIERKAGVLYVNPGSAGPRRFSLPVTVARLTLRPSGVEADLIDILSVPRTVSGLRPFSA